MSGLRDISRKCAVYHAVGGTVTFRGDDLRDLAKILAATEAWMTAGPAFMATLKRERDVEDRRAVRLLLAVLSASLLTHVSAPGWLALWRLLLGGGAA